MSQHQDITPLAYTNYRNNRQVFGIKADDRRRHFYVIGKTGMGKSTLLENMTVADIRAGHGLAVVDPHGEFAEKMLDYVPQERIKDVIYFDPSDQEFPIAFNVFEQVPQERQHLVASGLLGVFKKLWADSWGPRLEYILRNAIISLLYYPEATLLDVMRILVDKEYRKFILPYIKDPVLTSFWVEEFSQYNQQFQSEAIAPIQNKVGQFLTAPLIRNIVGQKKSAFDARQVMDEKKILILNLSKGRIGEDNSALLGAMMITKIQLAAMSRIEMAESERPDFYLYVDEFQNFATDSFANILSEARKYRLNLIMAHQYIEQLDRERTNKVVRDAVFGNVGTIVCFRVGAEDAEFLEKEFEPTIMAQDLVNLAKYNIYIKLMIDGVASQPFSAETLANYERPADNFRTQIIDNTRFNYATPRAKVAEDISRLYGQYVPAAMVPGAPPRAAAAPAPLRAPNPNPMPMMYKPPKPLAPTPAPAMPAAPPDLPNNQSESQVAPTKFFATCWKCGDTVKIPFQPDGKRPVFCKNCFKKAQQLKESGQLPSISAYLSHDDTGGSGGASRPSPGFAALKDILEGKKPEPSGLVKPKVTHHITAPAAKPMLDEKNKQVQESQREELKGLLTETLKAAGRDINGLKFMGQALNSQAEASPEPATPVKTTKKTTPAKPLKKTSKSRVIKPGEVIKPEAV